MCSNQIKPAPGTTGGQSIFGRWINHDETYGPHIVRAFLQAIPQADIKKIIDLGAGSGRDLQIAHEIFPKAERVAIENYQPNVEILRQKVDQVVSLDIERDPLPFAAESLDVVIANQILEHTKEIFWITHEITRCLKVGGHFIVGVPNVASLHNRLLLLLGQHPTQHKLYSAHVRPFSKQDTLKFMEVCFPGGFALRQFSGSQFYPFPATLARIFCRLLPNMSFSIFFMFRKVKPYQSGFLDHPINNKLETPFFVG